MEPGYYWWFNYQLKVWYIVLVTRIGGELSVMYHGTDVEQTIDEAKRDGEFYPVRIPHKNKRVP